MADADEINIIVPVPEWFVKDSPELLVMVQNVRGEQAVMQLHAPSQTRSAQDLHTDKRLS